MAKSFFLLASILLLSLCSSPLLVSSETDKKQQCESILIDMLPCLDYAKLGSNLTAPDDNCCIGLNKIVKADPTCLCVAADMAKAYNINVTRAQDLPKACKTNYNGKCSADSPPAPAPAQAPAPAPRSSVTAPPPDSEISSAPSPAIPVSSPPPPSESHSASGIPPVQSPSEGPSSASSELLSSLKFLLALAIATFAFLAV